MAPAVFFGMGTMKDKASNPALHIDRKGRASFNFNKLLVHDAETASGIIEFPSGK